MANEPVVALADRLAAIAPVPGSKVFFTSGGSDAVDTAAKLVRRYWALRGQPRRTTIITRERAYHGMHWGGSALSGIEPNRAGYGEWGANVVNVAWDDADELARVIDERGAGTVAAFFAEPVIGAAALANLDIIEREQLVGRVRELEPVLADTVGPRSDHSLVSEVRSGVGLLAAVQIDPQRVAAEPSVVASVVAELRARGVLTRALVDGSLQVSPPFVVSPEQLKQFATACWDSLEAVLTAR
jgi:adenosylmethionine-8-amino-7-oxononanoate aminotransferase